MLAGQMIRETLASINKCPTQVKIMEGKGAGSRQQGQELELELELEFAVPPEIKAFPI